MTQHMQCHIDNNCQGTRDEVIAQANTDLELEIFAGTGLLDQHYVIGLNKQPPKEIICQGTKWEGKAIQTLLELHPLSNLVPHVLDFQCKTCSGWFLCPLSLRYHSITCQ